nr:tail fiber protein [Lacinutrix neustonica]
MFGGNFAPRGWAFCDGQLLPISSNSALFSILGTTYGGDGRTTFALPDLRGRVPLGPRTGAGLSTYREGQRSGEERHVLNVTEMPNHNHIASGEVKVNSADATKAVASTGSSIATPGAPAGRGISQTYGFNDATPDVALNAASNSVTIGNNGGNQAHNNMQPYLAVNYIIALQGVFPSRS